MDPFRFTIALPTDADSLPLLGELCNHVAQFVGLGERDAREAKQQLQEVVTEQMRAKSGSGPIEVVFERKAGEATVTVQVDDGARRFVWPARGSG